MPKIPRQLSAIWHFLLAGIGTCIFMIGLAYMPNPKLNIYGQSQDPTIPILICTYGLIIAANSFVEMTRRAEDQVALNRYGGIAFSRKFWRRIERQKNLKSKHIHMTSGHTNA